MTATSLTMLFMFRPTDLSQNGTIRFWQE